MPTKQLLNIFILGCSILSCKKSTTPNPPPIQPAVDVYLTGSVGSGNLERAVYWKNDSLVGLAAAPSSTSSISVYGPDTYVTGSQGNSVGYWKNGVFVSLSDTISLQIGGLASNGNYAFIVAYNKDSSAVQYYRNTELFNIPTNQVPGKTTGITTFVTSIYVSGVIKNQNGVDVAVYWKDGTLVTLSDGTKNAYTSGILLYNGNVYISGGETDSSNQHYIAKYWVNDAPVTLPDSNNVEITTGITVDGSNIYLSGYEQTGTINSSAIRRAKFWKNGAPVNIDDGSRNNFATSIAAKNSNLYVVFRDVSPSATSVASYLFNDQVIALKDGIDPALANSIFLVSH